MGKIFYEARHYINDEESYESKYFQSFEEAKNFCENKIVNWYEEGAFDSYYNGHTIITPLKEILKKWHENKYSIYGWIEIIECHFEN